jgi:solute carrier family 25 (mitochondrial phosphate transporter), member 3
MTRKHLFPRLSFMLTAWDSTAIDVVKTRIQIDPALARHSLLSGGRLIVAKEGPSALLTGFGPTAVGYFVQGGGKFAGYEFWKKQFVKLAGDKDTAVRYRTPIYLGAASVGEYASDLLDQITCCRANLPGGARA